MNNQEELINYLIATNQLKSENIVNAFYEIDRKDFVLDEFEKNAYDDIPLPIGSNQTISQPSVVAFMLELLEPQEGETILEIGSGSGWVTALLSKIVGDKGKVYGVELLPELVELGERNLEKYDLTNAEIIQVEHEVVGLPEFPTFNRIIVSASSDSVPEDLKKQFKKSLVIPIKNSILKLEKGQEEIITEEEYPGFQFVPLK